jgi:hypothetical protein
VTAGQKLRGLWARATAPFRRKAWIIVLAPNGGFLLARVPRCACKDISAQTASGEFVSCTLVTDQGSLRVFRASGGGAIQGRIAVREARPN